MKKDKTQKITNISTKILIVDDEPSIRITLREFLIESYEVFTAENVDQALDLIAQHNFDVVITDIILPRITGVVLLKKIRQLSQDIQVIMITGEPTVETAAEAVRAGAFDYLPKPVLGHEMQKLVAKAVKAKQLKEQEKTYLKNLDDRARRLKQIADKLTFMDPEEFQKKQEILKKQYFTATYLIVDAVDSVKSDMDQAKFQRILKRIVKKHGAIWGNAWGDMLHTVFADHFFKVKEGHEYAAYLAAVEICKTIKEQISVIMRVGLATGPIEINKDTIQMNQQRKTKIIEKAWLAQEGRVGISTLQRPSKELQAQVNKLGYQFISSKDLVRGTLTSIWQLMPIEEDNSLQKIKQEKILAETASLRILLTKGVCGHGHLEGGQVSTRLLKVFKKVEKLYEQDKELAARFYQLTGQTHHQVLKKIDKVKFWGESRKKFDFEKHFLPWLYIGKLAQASSPEIIYDFTKIALELDLEKHAGISREIYPLVWLEMGLDFEECTDAVTRAFKDVLSKNRAYGPIKIGIGVKRPHLVETVKEGGPLARYKYPYLKCLDVALAFKESSLNTQADIFIDIIDVARSYPLFNSKVNADQAKHTAMLLKEANKFSLSVQIHVLEELANKDLIDKKEKRTKELPFVLDLLEKLKIKKARLIHMAYWPKNLPYLKQIKKGGHEIAVCQTSTRMLGATHKPVSPFLLANKKVVEGIIYDDKFPRIIISTDDAGPFGIKNVWSELIGVYRDISKWHGEELANLALISLLRNDYENLSAAEIIKKYYLNQKAVEWVMAYDLYKKKAELKDQELAAKVGQRAQDVLEKRRRFLKN